MISRGSNDVCFDAEVIGLEKLAVKLFSACNGRTLYGVTTRTCTEYSGNGVQRSCGRELRQHSRVFQHVPTIILDGDSSGVHFDVGP